MKVKGLKKLIYIIKHSVSDLFVKSSSFHCILTKLNWSGTGNSTNPIFSFHLHIPSTTNKRCKTSFQQKNFNMYAIYTVVYILLSCSIFDRISNIWTTII